MGPREYELQRQENIRRNEEILKSLGLEKPVFEPKQQKRAPEAKKRGPKRASSETSSDVQEEQPRKVQRVTAAATEQTTSAGPRRSGRNAGKTINYTGESTAAARRGVPEPVTVKARREGNYGSGPEGREDGKRKYDPKTYGSIPGIEVGTWWQTRQGCSVDSIHASWVGGITAGKNGAYSVALSGGYEDDVDLGYAFTYTGSGGRDLKGTKQNPKNLRTAPQSSDQTFDNTFNRALQRSAETKNPVRVIRGFKCKSKYAPAEGYRYDGLYIVEKAWTERGLNDKGYLVCKFAFKRLPGQKPLEVREDRDIDHVSNDGDSDVDTGGDTEDVNGEDENE